MTACFASQLLSEATQLSSTIISNEMRRRTVIGRAYYACYHALLSAARSRGFRYDTKAVPHGRHEQLIAWCKRHLDEDIREAAQLVGELRVHRVSADYGDGDTLELSRAHEALNLAKEVVVNIFGLPHEKAAPAA